MRAAALPFLLVVATLAQAQLFVPHAGGLPVGQPGTASDAGWSGLQIADVDGDGHRDVTAIGRKGTGSRVFRYQGAGVFSESSIGLYRPLSGRSEVAIEDFDNDGLMDVVDADWGGHFQVPGGAFVAMPNAGFWAGEGVAAGDVNADGIPDVVVTGHLSGTLKVLRGDGAGNWVDSSVGLPTAPVNPGVGGGRKCKLVDLDNDGDLDLVAMLYFNTGVWLNDGFGSWTESSAGILTATTGGDYYGVDAADFNGDGFMDLVLSDFTGANNQPVPQTAYVYLGNGGSFWTHVASTGIPTGLSANDVAAGDLDGDGIVDLAIGIRADLGAPTGVVSQVLVFKGAGNGTFAFHADSGLPAHPDVVVNLFSTLNGRIEAIDVADLNGDGLQDLAYVAYGFGVFAYRQNGALPFGFGVPGAQGFVPVASAPAGQPYLGNLAFSVLLSNAAGGVPAILAAGDVPGPVGLPGVPGAILWVDPFLSTQLAFVEGQTSGSGPGQGTWSVAAPIPSVASLLGVRAWLQFGIADPGAAGGIALSNGLRISLGW
jgi:hypothetical protein